MMYSKASGRWDVLIVGAGRSTVGRQISRRLSTHGLRVCSIDNVHKLNEHDFIREVKKKALHCSVRMIIPVFYPEVVARHKEEFAGITIPVDDEDKIKLLDNKKSACKLAEALGIPQPRFYQGIDSVESYPVVFKRVFGHGGDSIYFPKNRESLENLVRSSCPGSYLITEEIYGDDVSVDALRWDGFFFAGAYRVILPKAKGVSVLRESIDAPQLVEMAQRMLEAVDYRGVCGLDFRVSADGKVYFLECNPRFSGGLRSQTASGFDMPWLLWQLANGIVPKAPHFKAGVRTQYLKGTMTYLQRRRRQRTLKVTDVLRCLFSGAIRFDDFLG